LEYRNKEFNEDNLPLHSDGSYTVGYGQRPELVRRFHGFKIEAAFPTTADWNEPWGGVAASDDKTNSDHRYNQLADGTYFHDEVLLHKAKGYGRPVAMFGDGAYVRGYIEAICDYAWRVAESPDAQFELWPVDPKGTRTEHFLQVFVASAYWIPGLGTRRRDLHSVESNSGRTTAAHCGKVWSESKRFGMHCGAPT
jgi:hypothetical protein